MSNTVGVFTSLVALGALMTPVSAKADDSSQRVSWTVGEWRVAFDVAASRLECVHGASGARIEGTLAFSAESEGGWKDWQVGAARDSVKTRLALLDGKGEVQGYLAVSGAGDVLRIGAVHRSAQNYPGKLTLRGTATLGDSTFACRTRPLRGSRVVQLASGPADSALNDSLFDMQKDTALQLGGERVSIRSGEGFAVEMTAIPNEALDSALTFEVLRDYYRSRYVPYYKPLDKARCPRPPTGWMSWNVYFDTAGENENLAEARIGAEQLKPFGMEIWHIESWQDNSDELPVSKFSNLTLRPSPKKFPHGMKWLADEIKKLGFKPGIWTVPFGTGDDAFYAEHKDWFLHDAQGKPLSNWCGKYVVDPSQEAVRKQMEETHRVMSQDWGYEYFKIDGMSGRNSGYCAHFYERDDVRAAFKEKCEDPYKLCVEALRRGIGPDRVMLACQGHYSGPDVSVADAGRIGADIVSHRRAPDWNNYLSQARTTLNQLFVNNIVWYGDPDTLLVGTANPDEVVRLATAVVGLSGQMMFSGDKLAELPAERMRLLQQCLPVCDIQSRDLFPIYDMLPVWDVKIRRPFEQWDVVALFNWSEQPADVAMNFAELGLGAEQEYAVYDFWSQAYRGAHKGAYTASVASHGCALLSVHAMTGHPQFLSSDRHVTQGGVDVEDMLWDEAVATLRGRVALVGGHATTLTFVANGGYAFESATADKAEVVEAKANADGAVVVRLQTQASGTTGFEVKFRK